MRLIGNERTESKHFCGRQGHSAKYIIVHSTASPPGDSVYTFAYLQDNARGVSVHEYCSPRWEVYIMVPDTLGANHCWSKSVAFPGGEHPDLANLITWGIELFQVRSQDTAKEIVLAGAWRVAKACKRLGLDSEAVLGHREIDPSRRSDPVGVDMYWFREVVRGLI